MPPLQEKGTSIPFAWAASIILSSLSPKMNALRVPSKIISTFDLTLVMISASFMFLNFGFWPK